MEKFFFIFYTERKIQNLKFNRKILIYKSKSLLISVVFCRVTTIVLVMISLCYNTYKDNIPVQNLFDQFAKKNNTQGIYFDFPSKRLADKTLHKLLITKT